MKADAAPMPRLRADLFLLVEAGLLLLGAQVLLRLLPFRVVRRLLLRKAPRRNRLSTPRIVRAVRTASRCLPGSTCLPQALAAHFLLASAGEEPGLQIGLAVDEQGRVTGHAWIECRGRVVIGGTGSGSEFTRLRRLGT